MAERSFADEVSKLRLGAGAEFRGEGILAVTKALLQAGVAYVGGYQGAPISHLMDVFSDADALLRELGVHFEASASEAGAAAMLAASVNYPLRGAVTWKSTVGTNVAADALANVASGGVTGGALIILGEDYGEGSSIMQERSHAFAMKSQIWLLDPRPNLPSITRAVEQAFELSEASNTPVMLELRIRACHLYGSFRAKDNRAPRFTLREAMENPRRDTKRIVLPPASFLHEHEKINARWPQAVEFIERNRLNEFLGACAGDGGGDVRGDGDANGVGLIVQGGLYNTLMRALERLGLADAYGATALPIYVLNVTYPLIPSEVERFCRPRRAVLMIEEGQPAFLEDALAALLRRQEINARVAGKNFLPRAGEYTHEVLQSGLREFLKTHAPEQLAQTREKITPQTPPSPPPSPAPKQNAQLVTVTDGAASALPARPPGFCTGCPERPLFTALRLLERELGPFHVSCDIGCHLFSILPPFNIGNTTMGYGLGWAGASAFNTPAARRTVSIMGDGGFWHNGLTSGVGNAVFNQNDNVLVVVDNEYAAATGGQALLSSRASKSRRSTAHSIEAAVRGVGVRWLKTVDSFDLARTTRALRRALTTREKGPKVIVARGECQLNRARRERPLLQARKARGARLVRQRFFVDAETCTGDHACIRLSGCPSLTIRENPDPLREDPVAYVDNACVGCGHCGEVAHAAVLCPSFAQVQVIENPNLRDRVLGRVRRAMIGALQRLAEKRRARRVAI